MTRKLSFTSRGFLDIARQNLWTLLHAVFKSVKWDHKKSRWTWFERQRQNFYIVIFKMKIKYLYHSNRWRNNKTFMKSSNFENRRYLAMFSHRCISCKKMRSKSSCTSKIYYFCLYFKNNYHIADKNYLWIVIFSFSYDVSYDTFGDWRYQNSWSSETFMKKIWFKLQGISPPLTFPVGTWHTVEHGGTRWHMVYHGVL